MRRRFFIALLALVAGCRLLAAQSGKAPAMQTPKPVVDGTAKQTGHYNPNQMLRLAIALKPPHLEEEQQFIKDLHDKKSPQFHRFLTAEQWNARRDEWMPSAADYTFVQAMMQGRVVQPGKFANWIAPPRRGIHTKPIDFEYVRFN